MPITTKTPGVYIEEVATLPASVVAVATAIPAFIGYTEKGASLGLTKINSMLEYIEHFGNPDQRVFVAHGDGADNTGDTADDVYTVEPRYSEKFPMYYQVRMFYANGGGTCYISSAGAYPADIDGTINIAQVKLAIDAVRRVDEVTLLLCPDAQGTASVFEHGELNKYLLQQCADLQDRFAILDTKTPESPVTPVTEAAGFRDNVGTENLKYGAAYYPTLNTGVLLEFSTAKTEIIVEDSNGDLGVLQTTTVANLPVSAKTGYVAAAEDALGKTYASISPIGAIAGVYASVDRNRGVWKAPANIALNNVRGLGTLLTDEAQENLNVHSTGKSINAIRKFAGKGMLVWGARTLAGNDNEWRYVPVRRLYNMAEESIKKATEAVVFEPNDANTWTKLRGMIENFLNNLWRQGALAGATPEDAYFVNVGLGETMTAQDILDGKLIVEIGMAAVRPAEFIILRFSHKLQEA